jgi:altronate hydrolase
MATNAGSAPSEGLHPLHEMVIHLHPEDNVAIARKALLPGTPLLLEQPGLPAQITVLERVPAGHKMALVPVPAGGPVRRYGYPIGTALHAIEPGQHVHTHNLAAGRYEPDAASGQAVRLVDPLPEEQRRTFLGFQRDGGRAGTRNYVAVIATSNCAAHTCRAIAHHFSPPGGLRSPGLAAYENVDGVIALTHTGGCGGSPDYAHLQRTLAGLARHPNVGAYLLVGLGCEWNLAAKMEQSIADAGASPSSGAPLHHMLVIQRQGGIRRTVAAGIEAIERLLPLVNRVHRTEQPLSELVLALQCGGSDSWSGITANPLVGLVADQVVRQGGTIVLSETPELYGAEHLLAHRAIHPVVGQKLLDKIHWWERYVEAQGNTFENNPGPGNRAGGLSNICEKSLGAIAKSGSTPLVAVYDYAQAIEARGFVFMDAPGYDPVSVTGQVAGGCNLVLFTTGRGSVFGSKAAPTIKICSNSATYQHMLDDMDLNAGRTLEGADPGELAAELLDLVVATASGRPTKSEAQGVGEEEFIPWQPSGVI